MAAEDNRLLHQAMRNLFCKLTAETRGGNLGNHAVLDMVDKRSVNVGKAGCCEMKILESHLGEFADNHVYNLVTSSEVVVERDCHSILKPTEFNGFFQGNHLGMNLLKVLAESSVLRCLTCIHWLAHYCGFLTYKRSSIFYATHKHPPLLKCLMRWQGQWYAVP